MYTHNLKIILLDDKNNIVQDNDILEEIKNKFTEENRHCLMWNGIPSYFLIRWNKVNLNKVDTHFMGDLFSSPIYEMDSIIMAHTQKTIDLVPTKYNVKFYISRLTCDKKICTNTCGEIM